MFDLLIFLISDRVAMGATHDPGLLKETLEFIKTKSRDQDIIYYFRGLSLNNKMRHGLTEYFKREYEIVSVCLLVKEDMELIMDSW
jgi:hypothetical protein